MIPLALLALRPMGSFVFGWNGRAFALTRPLRKFFRAPDPNPTTVKVSLGSRQRSGELPTLPFDPPVIRSYRRLVQKTRDRELWSGWWIARRFSIYLSAALWRWVHPNVASVMGIASGVLGAYAVFLTRNWMLVWPVAISAYFAIELWDCVDGEIARLRVFLSGAGAREQGQTGLVRLLEFTESLGYEAVSLTLIWVLPSLPLALRVTATIVRCTLLALRINQTRGLGDPRTDPAERVLASNRRLARIARRLTNDWVAMAVAAVVMSASGEAWMGATALSTAWTIRLFGRVLVSYRSLAPKALTFL
jgi:hypothetical protein